MIYFIIYTLILNYKILIEKEKIKIFNISILNYFKNGNIIIIIIVQSNKSY